MYTPTLLTNPLYTLCTYGMAEYYKNDLSKMIAVFLMVHSYIYIYQSCDCHVFSLVTILGNMYNLCELHSLIYMCSDMCSGCHLVNVHSYTIIDTNIDMKQ